MTPMPMDDCTAFQGYRWGKKPAAVSVVGRPARSLCDVKLVSKPQQHNQSATCHEFRFHRDESGGGVLMGFVCIG